MKIINFKETVKYLTSRVTTVQYHALETIL
jgi:hypothetical protein